MAPIQMTNQQARSVAARSARQRETRMGGIEPRRALPLQYDESGFPIRQPTRTFSERVRQLLLG